MKICITGGLGHIGSYLLDSCISYSNKVTIVDNLSTQRYCSLRYTTDDIFIESGFEKLDKEFLKRFDVVIHLAAITDAYSSFNEEVKNKINKINIDYTKDLINKLDRKTLFVFPSSTSVYGTSDEIVTEESPVNPQSPYAESKVIIEEYLKNNCENYITFRLGTIFGTSPGMRFHTAINKFCYQFRFDNELTIWKDNFEMLRPYLGLNDCKEAIRLAINDKLKLNEIYNVVSENKSVKDILQLLQEYKDVRYKFVDTPLLNQFSYTVSTDKIESFGFKPNNTIEFGIYNTLYWLGYRK